MGKMNEILKRRKFALSAPAPRRRLGAALCGLFLIAFLAGCTQFPDVRPYEPDLAPDRYEEALQLAGMAQSLGQIPWETYVYRIHPTDVIEIKVFNYEKMDLMTRVGIGGKINFPPLGEIQAAGLTQNELETAIENGLRGDYLKEPNVIAFVREAASQNVTILGEVNTPGLQAVWGEVRLLEVLAKAGGLTEVAGHIAYLIREDPNVGVAPAADATQPETRVYRIYLAGLLQRGEREWNIPLRPGDTITVPPAGSIHVTGPGIKTPGTYPLAFIPKSMRQVLDEAGGITVGASRNIILARNNGNDQTEYFKVDYRKALEDSRYDVLVEPGDRLVVVTSFMRHNLDYVQNLLLNSNFNWSRGGFYSILVGQNSRYATTGQ